jgi:hypothetical protein
MFQGLGIVHVLVVVLVLEFPSLGKIAVKFSNPWK